MRIILPMAGHGKRFTDAGYTVEKPLIEVNGKKLLDWSLDCVPPEWERILVTRNDQHSDLYVAARERGFPLVLKGSTRGAAMTTLAAAVGLPSDEPVAVMNCDQWFVCDLDTVTAKAMREGWDGYILTFNGTGKQWSYALTDDEGEVYHVVEKPDQTPLRGNPTVGFYWWRRAGDLVHSICKMIAAGDTVNKEFYLAPSYNYLGMHGETRVMAVLADEFVGLGTPEAVRAFENAATFREP